MKRVDWKMKSELIAGIFGVFATLVGVFSAHAVATWQQNKNKKNELEGLLYSVVDDVRHVKESLQETESFVISLPSADVLRSNGWLRELSIESQIELRRFSRNIDRINQLTDQQQSIFFSMIESGEIERLSHDDGTPSLDLKEIPKERASLVVETLKIAPQLEELLLNEASLK